MNIGQSLTQCCQGGVSTVTITIFMVAGFGGYGIQSIIMFRLSVPLHTQSVGWFRMHKGNFCLGVQWFMVCTQMYYDKIYRII